MADPSVFDNIVVVLYQPQDLVNVAAIIRVMSNFGLSRLRLVEPAAWDEYRVEGIAHHTRPIIEKVEHYPDLDAALADCGFVLATTARKRGTRREQLVPREAAPAVLTAAAIDTTSPTAILFGREDNGLPNEALDNAHALVTIPTSPFNASLNLAQATLVIAYELWQAAQPSLEPAVQQAAQAATQSAEQPTHSSPEQPAERPAERPVERPIERPIEPTGQPPRHALGETPSVVQAVRLLQEDARLATGSDREVMFKALADLLWALYPDTTEQRVVYSMTRLRAVLLRAAPRKDEARALSHLFHHLIQAVKGSGVRGQGSEVRE